MKAEEIYQKTVSDFALYKSSLLTYNDHDFNFKSSPDVWSLAQMYEHICSASKKFFLANTKRCLENRNGQIGGNRNAAGDNVFKYGGFPPIKIKVPPGIDAQAIVGKPLNAYLTEIDEILESAKNMIEPLNLDSGEYKILHPVLGWLHALEWFQNLEMHTRHHFRQKEELENLAKNG
jgi:hypothetical protein